MFKLILLLVLGVYAVSGQTSVCSAVGCGAPMPDYFENVCGTNVWCNAQKAPNTWQVGKIITWGLKLQVGGSCVANSILCGSFNVTAVVIATTTVTNYQFMIMNATQLLGASSLPVASRDNTVATTSTIAYVGSQSSTTFPSSINGSTVSAVWALQFRGVDFSTLQIVNFTHLSTVAPPQQGDDTHALHYQSSGGLDGNGKRTGSLTSVSAEAPAYAKYFAQDGNSCTTSSTTGGCRRKRNALKYYARYRVNNNFPYTVGIVGSTGSSTQGALALAFA